MGFRSGFATIIGRPNVGKSTLLNLLTGEKISIISSKPQTTRNTIKAIITTDEYQVVFIDTPGLHRPRNKLGDYMQKSAISTLDEVDVILYMVEATDKTIGPGDREIIEMLKKLSTPVILLINKIDLVSKPALLPLIDEYSKEMNFEHIIPVSALDIETKELVLRETVKYLPEGPAYYPADMVTDQQERFLVQELIREKILHLVSDEVPHGVGVEVILFKEIPEKELIEIHANIYCEKESHKGIVIGKNGEMLKKIGTLARQDAERLLGSKIFLKLWVKTKEDWRNSDYVLRELGYK
ncbi:GTP-bindig protein Era [Thermoclostridium stercorarium subsp. stercorarium DSM 8532]|uniref:GTPase Era n=1 Tax=Thermoclostridium stercorarium (strain ATCC 35414 / DSM 8532 / NCIMB 11754) TaxID=1121335 RepID=L7VTV8_THES1|nr:GTPase Era [Thermoclostridium stercorarium]AGC69018.1 GTP-bindig protein Era [Thermoclostridium stercorarium subsp. stercorarium DSM 8532]AGI39995.1 Era [Thermoclostridium stercorarium subsp. stercorarium DSM 8532]UZQ84985.1 GTPase Era [Thermoclostridium stercorarium]